MNPNPCCAKILLCKLVTTYIITVSSHECLGLSAIFQVFLRTIIQERNRALHYLPFWQLVSPHKRPETWQGLPCYGFIMFDGILWQWHYTLCEAWSAFNWHHSSVFHCQWKHNQVFLLFFITYANLKSIFICVMKYVSRFISKLGINFAVCIKWIDETWNNWFYCWCPIVMRWSLWLQQWLLWLHHCDVIRWDKQSCVTMAVDL